MLRFRHLPMILETPKGIEDGEDLDVRNLRIARSGWWLGDGTGKSAHANLSSPQVQSIVASVLHSRPRACGGWKDSMGIALVATTESQLNGPPAAAVPAPSAGPVLRCQPVHQPRAELARLQRAGARGGARPLQPAARPAPVPGDLRLEPRRVLRGPGGRPAGPALREPRAPGPASRRDGPARPACSRSPAAPTTSSPGSTRPGSRDSPRAPRARDPGLSSRGAHAWPDRVPRRLFRQPGLPGSHPPGHRPRASVSRTFTTRA